MRQALATPPTPTPDPSSPCGARNEFGRCNWTPDEHTWARIDGASTAHPHVPTRCTCGHPIEAINPGPAASGSEGGSDHG